VASVTAHPGGYQPGPAGAADDPALYNPARLFGFVALLGLVLVRFSMLHQLLTYVLHVNLLLLYLFGLPALLGMVLSGGIGRAFRSRAGVLYTGYALWMVAAVPFSSWRGGSAGTAFTYLRTEYVMLLLIAGLTITWSENRMLLRAIGWAGVMAVASARFFRDPNIQERMGLQFGSLANPNDYACLLLLLLPMVAWLAMSSRSFVFRVAMIAVVGCGLYLIVNTASRGAAVALAATTAVFLWHGTSRQRLALLVGGPVLLAVAVAANSEVVLQRIRAFGTSGEGMSAMEAAVRKEAGESMALRQHMLLAGIRHTITHPVFGVGPGQLPTYEGKQKSLPTGRGVWLQAHNTLVQVSSEMGLPALGFFVAAYIASFRLLSSAHRKARARSDCGDIEAALFCAMLSLTAFGAATMFLSFAYYFYFPAMGGLAIVMNSAAEREFTRRGNGVEMAVPAWQSAQR
jgi:O-antigen ligase